jgi:hypothetical protein
MSGFLMFVPSLSWQNDGIFTFKRTERTVFLPEGGLWYELGQGAAGDAAAYGKRHFFSTFPMFVPSLSW